MAAVLPPAFFFRFAIPTYWQEAMPGTKGRLLSLPETCRLPNVGLSEESPFGDVRVAWNERGFGASVEVRGKTMPISCRADQPAQSDGLQLWIDTRDTQSIHRASRYCHHFCFLPTQATERKKSPGPPVGMEQPIARARELRELASPADFQLQAELFADGYRLEIWLPANVLVGYDPDANPRLGFFYQLQDAEFGQQFLTVGTEFPFDQDPSVWSTLELVHR